MKQYKLILNERQLIAISSACEIVCRLKSGQWSMAVESCEDERGNHLFDWDLVKQIEDIIKPRMGLEYNQSWGIGKNESADILWDIHQVLRHQISWDRAREQGHVSQEGNARNWSKMWGVSYDEPMQFSKEPLLKIEKIAGS